MTTLTNRLEEMERRQEVATVINADINADTRFLLSTVKRLVEVLRNVTARSDGTDSWMMIPDSDGDAGPDECFFCGSSKEASGPFKHWASCAGLTAVNLLAELEGKGE